MQYQYVAYNLEEGLVKGRVEARDEDEARSEVQEQGYKPLRITQVWKPPSREVLFPSFYKVKPGDLIGFIRQLATMTTSCASLTRTLEMLQAESSNPVMQRTIGQIQTHIDAGGTVSSAMAEHPTIFDPLYISLVQVGEFTGALAPALDELADMMELARESSQRIVKSMMMPLFQVGMAVLMVGLNVFVLLPPLFESFDDDKIPLMMKVLLGLSDWVKANPLQLIGGIFVFIVVWIILGKIQSFNDWRDAMKARAPIIGPLIVSSQLARFSRAMGMLMSSGVNLADALRLSTNSVSNRALRKALIDAEESLVTGEGMSDALRRHPVMPSVWVELVNIGEQSNTLDQRMGELAVAYQRRMEGQINAILAILEPVSTLMVGGIVIFLAMSMLQPIMSQMSEFSG